MRLLVKQVSDPPHWLVRWAKKQASRLRTWKKSYVLPNFGRVFLRRLPTRQVLVVVQGLLRGAQYLQLAPSIRFMDKAAYVTRPGGPATTFAVKSAGAGPNAVTALGSEALGAGVSYRAAASYSATARDILAHVNSAVLAGYPRVAANILEAYSFPLVVEYGDRAAGGVSPIRPVAFGEPRVLHFYRAESNDPAIPADDASLLRVVFRCMTVFGGIEELYAANPYPDEDVFLQAEDVLPFIVCEAPASALVSVDAKHTATHTVGAPLKVAVPGNEITVPVTDGVADASTTATHDGIAYEVQRSTYSVSENVGTLTYLLLAEYETPLGSGGQFAVLTPAVSVHDLRVLLDSPGYEVFDSRTPIEVVGALPLYASFAGAAKVHETVLEEISEELHTLSRVQIDAWACIRPALPSNRLRLIRASLEKHDETARETLLAEITTTNKVAVSEFAAYDVAFDPVTFKPSLESLGAAASLGDYPLSSEVIVVEAEVPCAAPLESENATLLFSVYRTTSLPSYRETGAAVSFTYAGYSFSSVDTASAAFCVNFPFVQTSNEAYYNGVSLSIGGALDAQHLLYPFGVGVFTGGLVFTEYERVTISDSLTHYVTDTRNYGVGYNFTLCDGFTDMPLSTTQRVLAIAWPAVGGFGLYTHAADLSAEITAIGAATSLEDQQDAADALFAVLTPVANNVVTPSMAVDAILSGAFFPGSIAAIISDPHRPFEAPGG